MSNYIDATGPVTQSPSEVLMELQEDYLGIYPNADFSSNAPDGQKINLFGRIISDHIQVIVSLYNQQDINNAEGVWLDRLTALQRQGATNSQQQINITVDRDLTLDTTYTVKDNNGQEFVLSNEANLTANTTTLLTFTAVDSGSITTEPNTIVNPVTVVLGVTAIDNPTGVLVVGQDEETDSAFRIRILKSVAITGLGSTTNILSQILNLDNVTSAEILENTTSLTDSNDIPPHSIWTIVEGGDDTEIANVIYENLKKSGTGMKGDVEVSIDTSLSNTKIIQFDRPISTSLYMQFSIKATVSNQTFDEDSIKSDLIDAQTFTAGETVYASDFICRLQDIVVNGKVTDLQVSDDNVLFTDVLDSTSPQNKWVLDATNITITIL